MSFGSPGGPQKHFSPTPPQRGSFPLDHLSECKDYMRVYLTCLSQAKGQNDACRDEARKYLVCRMERNLMAKEEMSNLGFKDEISSKRERGTENCPSL